MRLAIGFAPVMRRLGLAALLLTAPAVTRAQSTKQQIDSAVALYQQFNVEAARPILLKIISPGYLQQVSSSEKATALKYLGASYAVLAAPGDSARNFFIAALDFDPFTDLDPTEFAASELAAFNEAKRLLFKVAIKPMREPALVQRDTAPYVFDLITTSRASLRVEIVNQADTNLKEVLYEGPNEGRRGVRWGGILTSTGKYAPPGTYQLKARATVASAPPGSPPLNEAMSIRIEHVFEPLEDTLATLDRVRELLAERIPARAPWLDLVKGGVLATAAIALPMVALNKNDIAWAPHAAAAAFVGLSSATISFYYRRNNPQIPQNVLENNRRRTVRASFNAAVLQRNRDRLDRTLLILSPVSNFGQ